MEDHHAIAAADAVLVRQQLGGGGAARLDRRPERGVEPFARGAIVWTADHPLAAAVALDDRPAAGRAEEPQSIRALAAEGRSVSDIRADYPIPHSCRGDRAHFCLRAGARWQAMEGS